MSNAARARRSKQFHVVCAVLWTVMMPVALVTGLGRSLPFIVIISLYALVISHLGAAAGKSAKEEAADPSHDES